ncbi:MAG: DUF6456 domain-containing protein [Pseudomonadota bacterium]
MVASSSKGRRQAISALRHLASGGPSGCLVAEQDVHFKLTNVKGAKKVTKAIATGWIAAGLASRNQPNRMAITSAGRAYLKRAIHEAEAGANAPSSVHASQHRELSNVEIKLADGSRQRAVVNLSESPLGWLYRRKTSDRQPMLSDAQFQAGERLRSDYERGRMRQRVSANWEAALAGGKRGAARGGDDLTDAAMDARTRVEQALGSLSDDYASLLQDVCCHLKSLSDVSRDRKWPRGTARIILTMALQDLARHYGFVALDTERRFSDIRSWGDGEHVPRQALADDPQAN